METIVWAVAFAFCLFCVCATVNSVATRRIDAKCYGRVTRRPTIRFALDEGLEPMVFAPERAHDTDAGADLRSPTEVRVPPHDSALVRTGVHVELPEGTCGLLVSKSGLMVHNALTSTGLVDEGFTGEIVIRVFNDSSDWYTFHAGDKVSQIAVLPVCYPTYAYASEISGGERGDDGYGSTGR